MIGKGDIHILSDMPLQSFIELSEGISMVENINGVPCSRKCYIPRGTWRIPTETEVKILQGKEDEFNHAKSIGIFKIPDNLLFELEQKNPFKNVKSGEDLNNEMQKPDVNNLISKIHQFVIDKICDDLDEFWFLGIAISPNSLNTISMNMETKEFVGLHIDSWDMKLLDERLHARNRITINIGGDYRYFLCINKSMQQIANEVLINKSSKSIQREDIRSINDAFLSGNYNYSVLRLKMLPGTFYIAPTENIIHDASTLGTKYFDLNATYLGHFSHKTNKNGV